MLIGLSIVVVLGLALWTRRSMKSFETQTIANTNQYMASLAREKSESVEKFVQEIQDYLDLLARRPFSGEFRKGRPLRYNDYVAGNALFDHVGGRVDSVYRINAKGRVLDRVPFEKSAIGKDFSQQPGVSFVLANQKPYVSGIFQISSDRQGLSICHPVFEKTDFLGMICVMVSLQQLNASVFHTQADAIGSVWIIDKDGLVVSHSDPAFVGRNIVNVQEETSPGFDWSEFGNIVKKMTAGAEGFGMYHTPSTFKEHGVTKKIAVFLPMRLYDQVWSIAIVRDYDEIAEPIQRNARNTLLGAGFMMFICVTWGFILYRNQKRKTELEAVSRWAEELGISNEKLKQEIEQRKQAEEARQESDKNYRLLAENVTDVIWLTDLHLRFTYISPSVTRVLGYSVQEIVGHTLEEVLSSPTWEIARKALEEDLKKEGGKPKDSVRSRTLDFEIHRKDGATIWAETKVNFLYDADGEPTGLLGTTRDITEKMQLQNQLFQAQKMESIGRLAGGVAHDFNNLLAGILGYASLMKTRLRKSNQAYTYADTIERSANRASELTEQLLAFARGGRCETRVVNLNSIVNETLEIIGRTFDKSIEIEIHLPEPLPTVEADAGQIQQVLMNLCVNARDAMPDGGRLIIETSTTALSGGQIDGHEGVKPGLYVTLSVTDTGMGMDKNTSERIFEPFFTTKEKGKGTGLGLSVVYGVVNNHEGLVRVYSELGGGSTFKIFLPASGKPEEKNTSQTKAPKGGDELILVVDDEEVIRCLAKDTLESYGYRVLLAENGLEALEVYRLHGADIGLVIMDMVMPKMGGQEAFSKLKQLDPHVKVLLSTGYSQDGETRKMQSGGLIGLVQKPYQLDVLLAEVRAALDIRAEC